MATYSFMDVTASLSGPTGEIDLGYGSASSEEGITVAMGGPKNTMTIGADGSGMHSLVANEASTVTIRLLKTSPVNAKLQLMYNLQTKSSLTHGKNVISVRDVVRGDSITLTQAAFKKRPSINYAKEGGMVEWTFDAVKTTQVLGVGTPEL